MNVGTKVNEVIQFGGTNQKYVVLRLKKNPHSTIDTSTLSPASYTLDYECRHESKCNDHVWWHKTELCLIESEKAAYSVQLTDM